MGRCSLLDGELPDKLWNYAVQTAAYVRNRCYSRRTKKTPYEMLTGKKPNIKLLSTEQRQHVPIVEQRLLTSRTTCGAHTLQKWYSVP